MCNLYSITRNQAAIIALFRVINRYVGNLHHLILNKKDRADMVRTIDIAFGRSLDDKNATSIVSAAWAIKYGLTRPNYKAADEP